MSDKSEPVTIKSFRLVYRSIERAAAGADASKLDQGRAGTRQAALDLVKDNLEQNVFYAVFVSNVIRGGYREFSAKSGGTEAARAKPVTFTIEPRS